jgi:cytidine deaminase
VSAGGTTPEAPGGGAIDWAALEQAARLARSRAHAPFSCYPVGAAVLGDDGRIHGGCNVENASYGLTICAERTAVVSMVAAGTRRLRAAVVITRRPDPGAPGPKIGTPCGACRQVMGEFCDDAPVKLISVDDEAAGSPTVAERFTTIDQLLPDRFRGELINAPAR